MPIYKYKCMECEHSVELVQSMKEGEEYQATHTTCEKCNSPEWKRVIGGTAFKLRGYGWFRDGY
jgi:Zn finger protein HypA/HybF involved in hydrogenase expression